MYGVEELRPILAQPAAGSPAEQAGVAAGDMVRSVSGNSVTTLQDMRWQLMQNILDRQPAVLETINERGEISFRNVATATISSEQLDSDFSRTLGLVPYQPNPAAIVGSIAEGSPAALAGIQVNDQVLAIDGQPIPGWNEFVKLVRASPGKGLVITLLRAGQKLELAMTPQAVEDKGTTVGRIGIGARDDPQLRAKLFVMVRLGPLSAVARAWRQTWDTAEFTLRMIGRMVIGELSWRNISGPVTIADYAGQSAHLGLDHYFKFLALISISLGVLNLLPIPILDGGHLLYYLFEAIKGDALPERAMEIGQQIGLGLLVLLMAIAFFNDINRLVSG
jgi:regulator of sigma E protease